MLIFNKNVLSTIALLGSLFATSISCMNIIDAARIGLNSRMLALIASGADVNQRDDNSWTPLHWAAANGHQVVARTLIAHAANVNLRDTAGRTPLHMAVIWRHLAIVQILIAAGADFNLPNNEGRTAWDNARAGRDREIINLFDRINDLSAVANRQLLALLSTGQPRLGALPSVRSVFQDTQINGLAHIIGKFVRQAAYEDALYHQPEVQQPHREPRGCIIS